LPSRLQPSAKSANPVNSAAPPRPAIASANAWAGGIADNTGVKVTIAAASRAAVLPRGPAIAVGKLLVKATKIVVTAVVISAAATP
jgi:hypothetical protein